MGDAVSSGWLTVKHTIWSTIPVKTLDVVDFNLKFEKCININYAIKIIPLTANETLFSAQLCLDIFLIYVNRSNDFVLWKQSLIAKTLTIITEGQFSLEHFSAFWVIVLEVWPPASVFWFSLINTISSCIKQLFPALKSSDQPTVCHLQPPHCSCVPEYCGAHS